MAAAYLVDRIARLDKPDTSLLVGVIGGVLFLFQTAALSRVLMWLGGAGHCAFVETGVRAAVSTVGALTLTKLYL